MNSTTSVPEAVPAAKQFPPARKSHPAKATGGKARRKAAAQPHEKRPLPLKPGTSAPWPEVLKLARQHFGIKDFRPGQREVLEQVFAGKSVLGLMPTGAGKSLTYQLPALVLPKPVVVVSPLIALMQDQQQHAAEADVAVEKIDSTITARQAKRADEEIADGIAQLIYVTPERLEKQEFLDELNGAGGISLLVVDEAHCIAQWGHDFRPAYLCIGNARRKLGMPPVLALTATATESVTDEILESLHAKDAAIVDTGTERTNLHFSVHATVNNEAKLSRVTTLLANEPGTGIIYTASVRTANELHDWLREHDISVGRYHGQMSARDRERVQHEFMAGTHKVMIATKAFGLGIDKPDIRFVYHFEFPDSLETYYQEAGRAGRDGLPSRAVLLYRLEDKRIQSFFMAGRYPTIHDLEAVWEAVQGQTSGALESSGDPDQSPAAEVANPEESATEASDALILQPATVKEIASRSGVGLRKTEVILHLLEEAGVIHEENCTYTSADAEPPTLELLQQMLATYTDRAQHDRDRLTRMMNYAETPSCRVQVIRQYFNDAAGEPCGRCDNCENPDAVGLRATHDLNASAEGEGSSATHSGLLPTTSTQTHRADEAHDGSTVTRVETMTGTIVTTAPETLPQAPSPCNFNKGDRVSHRKFGEGSILDADADIALVRFITAGEKKVRCTFLRRAR